MNLMEKNTKRLNLYTIPETYDQLQKAALQEGRKVGSLARHVLNKSAEGWNSHKKERL